MRTERVSTVQFESQRKFVNKEELRLVREISEKMCNQSTVTTTENMRKASYISSVRAGGCLLYNDTFLHEKDKDKSTGSLGKTQMEFFGKTIAIDNNTGEIIEIKNPENNPIDYILKTMDKYLKGINLCFYEDDVVTKNMSNINSFTPKGFERIMSGEISIDNESGEINV